MKHYKYLILAIAIFYKIELEKKKRIEDENFFVKLICREKKQEKIKIFFYFLH